MLLLYQAIEFRDLDSCSSVIGVLQPVTSACGVVSVVKSEMLLMIEKLLLRQRSHGYSLLLTDTSNEPTSAGALPVKLRENITTVGENATSECETAPMSACRKTDIPLKRRENSRDHRKMIEKSQIG